MFSQQVNQKYSIVGQDLYKSLNDAAVISPDLAKGSTKVWYAKSSRDLGMGYDWCAKKYCLPDIEDLKKTHVLLGSVKGTDEEKIFGLLQGEIWSPNGEAHNLIDKSGAKHTSMSVGDIIEMNGKCYMADIGGFRELHRQIKGKVALAARMGTIDIDRILVNLENAEEQFEKHVAVIKKSDSQSDTKALNWSENVLADIRSLISLIADKK